MNKILKSYMKSFFKNWLSTLFIVIFLISLSTAIIGILTTPIQIYSKLTQASNQTVKYDNQISLKRNNSVAYSNDFIFEYLFEDDASNPLESSTLSIMKYNNNVEKEQSELKQSEKDKIGSYWNSVFSAYRSSSLESISFTLADFSQTELLKKQYDSIEAFKQAIFLDHVYKSFLEGKNEYNNLLNTYGKLANQDYASIVAGIFYRIFQFTTVNGISINWNSININELLNFIKLIIANFTNDEKIMDISEAFFKLLNYEWDTSSDSEYKLKILSYTFLKPEATKILSSPNYQHDDRIYVLYNLINGLDGDYELAISTNISASTSANLIGGRQSYDIKSSYSYVLSDDVSQQESSMSKIIFDESVAQNSLEPEKWTNRSVPQVVISSAYAKANNLSIGDPIKIPKSQSVFQTLFSQIVNFFPPLKIIQPIFITDLNAKIVGIGETFEDYIPGASFSQFEQETSDYAYIYADKNFVQEYKNFEWKFLSKSEGTATTQFKIKNKNNNGGIVPDQMVIKKPTSNIIVFNNTSDILKTWGDSSIDDTSVNIKIRIIIFIILAVVILTLAFIFINFNLKKEINDTRKQLGIFKSSGYFTSELSWIFALKTFALFFFSIFIGFFLSFPFQNFASQGFDNSLTIYYAKIYFSAPMFFGIVFGIPILFLLIGFLLTLRDLSEKPLSLINNAKRRTAKVKSGPLVRIATRKNIFFTWRLRRAFIKNSKGKFVVIQILFAFSSLAYILIFGAQTVSAKIINQSFSVYNDELDHYYNWSNATGGITVKDEGELYDWYSQASEPLDIQYVDNSNYKSTNEYLLQHNQNKELDYRFKVSALFQMISNYYNELDFESKVRFIIPENEFLYTLENSFGVATNASNNLVEDNPSFLKMFFNYNLDDQQLSEAAKEVKLTGKTNKKINLSANIKNNELTLKNITSNEMSNFFYNEVLGMFSIKLFQTIAIYDQLPNIINKNVPFEDWNDFLSKLNSGDNSLMLDYETFVNNLADSELISLFQPNSSEFWSNSTKNPLFQNISKVINQDPPFSNQQIISLLFSFNMQSLGSSLSTGLFTSNATPDNLFDKMINVNTVFFDAEQETLMSEMWFKIGDGANISNLHGYLLSTNFNEYGDFKNVLNFDGISSNEMDNFINPKTEEIPAIIPYYMAKDKDLKVGDIMTIKSYPTSMLELKIKVVGINKSETIKLAEDSIMLNKEYFETKYFSDNLRQTAWFTDLFSKKPMLETEMSLANIFDSFSNTTNLENNLTLASGSNKPIYFNMFNKVFEETSDNASLDTIQKIDLGKLTDINLKVGMTKKSIETQISKYFNVLFSSESHPNLGKDYLISYPSNALNDENWTLSVDDVVTISAIEDSAFFISQTKNQPNILMEDDQLPDIVPTYDLTLITNPSFISTSNSGASVTPLNILKAAINLALDIADKIMIVFVLLSTVILSIILLVVIGIVVDEAKATILTMKALGYNSFKINWAVIGSYLIGLVVSFFVAFIISIIIWKLVLLWVSLDFGVYIFLGIDYRSAYITAPIILFVLLVGWYAADKQVKKNSLTQITNMT